MPFYAELQSTYRVKNSTSLPFKKVVSDIHLAIDQTHGLILILLELISTFDNVDYNILVGRLASRLGIHIFVAIHKMLL